MLQKKYSNSNSYWPPPYTIRQSPRAKHVYLRITPATGLEVVIPSFRKRFNIPLLLAEKRNWIEKNLHLLQQLAPKQATTTYQPKILALNALAEIWRVSYITANTNKFELYEFAKQHLALAGKLPADEATARIIQALLINWLKQRAKAIFPIKLSSISQKISLPYQQVTIRGQKTLWGSCNSKQNISLNFKLLFLPTSIFNYVLCHELCHTKHLNHSAKFWDLLSKYDKNCLAHDQELKNGDQYVPQWLLNF
jgi:predicted metal-dependent hydrolase